MKHARNLGFASTEELFSKMTAKQMQEWETFGAIEPFPEDKIVQALAFIASIFANGTLKKIDKSPWTMEDFIFKYFSAPKKVKKQSTSTMKKMFNVLGQAFGKKEKEIEKERKKRRNKHRIKYKLQESIPRRMTPPANPVKRVKRRIKKRKK